VKAMNIIKTDIAGVFILEPVVFDDDRGWFMESWSAPKMRSVGLEYDFVQDNHSYSTQRGVLRGIHYQRGDAVQAKLVRCLKGNVLDVAVDLRKGSPSYMKWVAVELSAENKRQLLIPRGLGHGFLTLTNNVEFLYKVDNLYNVAAERSIRWNDPELDIDWGISRPIMSQKDVNAPLLRDSDCGFVWRI